MIKPTLYLMTIILLFAVSVTTTGAVEKSASGNDIVASIVEGTAQIYTPGKAAATNLKKGDHLKQNQEVRVGERSKVELQFPDGTAMRLSEKSRLNLAHVSYDQKTEGKNMKVGLSAGKLWARVKKLITPDSSVEVVTSNAVAGVRGTVYRVNVEADSSAVVKVYDGSVYVANPPRDPSKPNDKLTMPVPVSGPHAVAPPMHEVSVAEWHVIVKAFQQVVISPQGVASQPKDFDPKADSDDWVLWNQQRDKETKF